MCGRARLPASRLEKSGRARRSLLRRELRLARRERRRARVRHATVRARARTGPLEFCAPWIPRAAAPRKLQFAGEVAGDEAPASCFGA